MLTHASPLKQHYVTILHQNRASKNYFRGTLTCNTENGVCVWYCTMGVSQSQERVFNRSLTAALQGCYVIESHLKDRSNFLFEFYQGLNIYVQRIFKDAVASTMLRSRPRAFKKNTSAEFEGGTFSITHTSTLARLLHCFSPIVKKESCLTFEGPDLECFMTPPHTTTRPFC